MVKRHFWLKRIDDGWRRRSVLWLAGVRRVGKTCLAQSLENIEYFDCELPRTRRAMEDPEGFLEGLRGKRVVLDEIHRLTNPSELLKIAADYFPETKVLATGSSLLGASAKFRDTLTGRKGDLWLTPMVLADLEDFGLKDIRHRLLRGGLPPFFLAPVPPEREFQEWLEGYWAKDVQELFRLERRHAFQKCYELLLAQSGGIFEATKCARPCEVSRTTIVNYVSALEATFVVHVIRPFHSHKQTEIVAAPKVYGFDTGFVCAARGWTELRPADLGPLWEHLVLNELLAHTQPRSLAYWRDKQGHEVDFVRASPGRRTLAIECKWSAGDFTPANFDVFAQHYPRAEFIVVAQDVQPGFVRNYRNLSVRFTNLPGLVAALEANRIHGTPAAQSDQ